MFLPLNLLLAQPPDLGTSSPGPSCTHEVCRDKRRQPGAGNRREKGKEVLHAVKVDSEGHSGGTLRHEYYYLYKL